MELIRDPDTGMFLKVCTHCGQASPSLGTRCPLCDRLYDPESRGVIDDLPLIDLEDFMAGGGPALGMIAGAAAILVINAAIVLLLGPPLALAKLIRRLIARRRGR